MNSALPLQNIELLNSFLGKKISVVKRQLFKDDMDLDEYEQNADGPVELTFDDKTVVHFVAETETLSIGVIGGCMPRYGANYALTTISNNSFWCDRTEQKIVRIVVLKSCHWSEDYPSEFGIEIWFENGKKVLIEYLNEEDFPDMIKVAEQYEGQPCLSQIIG